MSARKMYIDSLFYCYNCIPVVTGNNEFIVINFFPVMDFTTKFKEIFINEVIEFSVFHLYFLIKNKLPVNFKLFRCN